MGNIVTVNSSSLYAMQFNSLYSKIELYDMYFEKTDALNNLIIDYQFIGGVIMSNITINNNDILNTDPVGFFHFLLFDNGVIHASKIVITNSDIGVKPIIMSEVLGSISMIIGDVFVRNVTLGTDTKIIKTQSLNSFSMNNSTFIDVKPQVAGDNTPKMVELSSLALTDQLNYTIIDTHIEQSVIGFIEISGIASNQSLTSYFVISNFEYGHSYLDFPQDLISFTGIETTNDF